jgi:hypothetical protein
MSDSVSPRIHRSDLLQEQVLVTQDIVTWDAEHKGHVGVTNIVISNKSNFANRAALTFLLFLWFAYKLIHCEKPECFYFVTDEQNKNEYS